MAKFLAYKRSTKQVVSVDTINPTVTNIGNTIVLADATNAFPNRSENLVAIFRGEPYFLYRSGANEIRLSKYDYGTTTWTDVVGFTAITTASGNLTPLGLHVERDRLVALAELSGSAGVDKVYARRSAQDDGGTWDAAVTLTFVTQPASTRAGPSIVWHNAVWFATEQGIGYYLPQTNVLAGALDDGSDSLITGLKACLGSFTFWDGDLYYILPTDSTVGAPNLYKLDKTWTPTFTTPTFTNQLVIIPGVGGVALGNDAGNYSLFVNKLNVMSLLYSGDISTKLITIVRSGANYAVNDVTDAVLSNSIKNEPLLGFSVYSDDRRRTNEQQTIICRFRPAVPVSIILLSWDGSSAAIVKSTLDDGGLGLDLMVCDGEHNEVRTFTNNEPQCHIDAFSQPFSGRIRLDYTVRDALSRDIDVIGEYSLDGQVWNEMSQGDGDSGSTALTSSPGGIAYFFHWNAYINLDGNYDNLDVRIIARISGV